MSIKVPEGDAADAAGMMEMPRYQSHKKVWALRIAAIETGGEEEDGVAKIAPADEGFSPFRTQAGWSERFNGSDDDLGYFVQYEDGYQSWSPTKAFEEGYTRIN